MESDADTNTDAGFLDNVVVGLACEQLGHIPLTRNHTGRQRQPTKAYAWSSSFVVAKCRRPGNHTDCALAAARLTQLLPPTLLASLSMVSGERWFYSWAGRLKKDAQPRRASKTVI